METGFLHFLKDSLQVDDFIRPLSTSKKKSAPLVPDQSGDALAFFVKSLQKNLSPEAEELLKKMTQAMGYQLEKVPRAQGPDILSSKLSTKVLVMFVEDENSSDIGRFKLGSGDFSQTQIMTTYSPEILLAQPALKKAAWSHLQLVMNSLKA